MTKCRILLIALLSGLWAQANAGIENTSDSTTLVYKIRIMESIMPSAWRQVKRGFDEAYQRNADIVLIHMNTYGGMVDVADSIRTRILNSTIPVWVFIDNQAASAGALISIACDSIYMRKGGSIGAATVVDQSGHVVPDKFQSFMRSTMRATAEAKGRVPIVAGKDTIYKWRRDPHIAEAMVDPSIFIEGIIDTGKVLTFTADEAIKYGYCEGKAETVEELLKLAGVSRYTITEFRATTLDKILGFLTNPIVSGVLIMLIIGGIYFELQTPGVGFPLAAAVVGAILYFAPHYLEGAVQHWEIIVFIVGLILVGIEIFAIPGFGIAGISGITLMVIGLALAMIDNEIFRSVGPFPWVEILRPFVVVSLALLIGLFSAIALSKKVLTSPNINNLALRAKLSSDEGFVGIDLKQKVLIGKTGVTMTVLRPSGKVLIDGEPYDAVSDEGFIEKGEHVRVIKDEAGQIYVGRG